MSAVLEKALAQAITIDDIETEVKVLGEQGMRLVEKVEGLLPIEARASEELVNRGKVIQKQFESYKAAAGFGFDLRQLSGEVLSWRRKDGWPALAPINVISNGTVTIGVQREQKAFNEISRHQWVESGSVFHFKERYEDVFAKLHKMNKRVYSYQKRKTWITATFDGVIPPEIRNKIVQAQKYFGEDKVYLLTEPEKWDLNTSLENIPRPAKPRDPIVIAVNGDDLWVIDKFDPTTLENYILAEWTASSSLELEAGSGEYELD